MNLRSYCKINARQMMRGHYGAAAVILLLMAGCTGLLVFLRWLVTLAMDAALYEVDSYFSPSFAFKRLPTVSLSALCVLTFFLVTAFLLLPPLWYGMKRWFHLRTYGENPSVAELFHYFSSFALYSKALWVFFVTSLVVILMGLILLIPATGFYVLSYMLFVHNPLSAASSISLIFSFVFAALALIALFVFSLRYCNVPYFLAKDAHRGTLRLLRDSARSVKGYKGHLFVTHLSFLLWDLLCLLIFPVFFVFPYMQATFAVYSRYFDDRLAGNLPAAEETEEQEPQETEAIPAADDAEEEARRAWEKIFAEEPEVSTETAEPVENEASPEEPVPAEAPEAQPENLPEEDLLPPADDR